MNSFGSESIGPQRLEPAFLAGLSGTAAVRFQKAFMRPVLDCVGYRFAPVESDTCQSRGNRDGSWDDDFHDCSGIRVEDSEFSPKFPGPLSHPSDAHADAARA